MLTRHSILIDNSLTNPPEISVVLTVYNQEKIIEKVLNGIIVNSSLKIDLIIIDDASSDNTNKVIRNIVATLKEKNVENIAMIRLIKNKISRFETFCDDLGIRICSCETVILIQSDMIISEFGFDKKMSSALSAYSDLIALSSRGVITLEPILSHYRITLGSDLAPAKSYLKFGLNLLFKLFFKSRKPLEVSKVVDQKINDVDSYFLKNGSIEISSFLPLGEDPRKIYIGQSIYRGPIILSKWKYLEIGGFNKKGFFQGFDDHGLSVSAFLLKKYRVGYVYISYLSPREFSTTSKKRSFLQSFLLYFNLLRIKPEFNVLKKMLKENEFKNFQMNEIRTF